MFDHEYSLLGGINRSKIGHIIGSIAALTSSVAVTFFLASVSILKNFGLGDKIPSIVMWPLTAGAIYVIIYWLFNSYVWRSRYLNKLLCVPDLAGEWDCKGQTINPDKSLGYSWKAKVTITQSWDKIRVRLKTTQSGSNSIAAALFYDKADGYRLMYNYANDPNVDEPELKAHRGFADLTFSPDLRSAKGEYFNGHGRFTFGTMKLTRKS